ncbi:hypothetical protein [Parendozoicomonas haliclonae]|uniref:Chromosome partition protein Smc n=1 Tax=Parendozoicomonas haliclonae TaxID=1960125 RepID=A0A1X7AEF3_9GAMM|nr:hypothetical protein [Parendozoicomonas haliclonae]SMA34461.1 Chromosome partition protein Smc [Parendozoicomonas haliclonae]
MGKGVTGSNGQKPSGVTIGVENLTPNTQPKPTAKRFTPKPGNQPHPHDKKLYDRNASPAHVSLPSFIPPESRELLEYPKTIPTETTDRQKQQQARLQQGVNKTRATGVRGTEHLAKLKPIDVICTPTRGVLGARAEQQTPGWKVQAGFGNLSHSGVEIHSSSINLDEPIAVTCRNVNVNSLISLFQEKGPFLPLPLTEHIDSPALAPEDELLEQTHELVQQTDEALKQTKALQTETLSTTSHVKGKAKEAEQLRHSLSETSRETGQLKKRSHKLLTQASVSSSQIHQITQHPPESPKAVELLQKRLLQHESTIGSLLKENAALQDHQQQLTKDLNTKASAIKALHHELELAKQAKQNLEAQLQQLKSTDVELRLRQQTLEQNSKRLGQKVVALQQALDKKTNTLEVVSQQLAKSKVRSHQLQNQINEQLRDNIALKKANEDLTKNYSLTASQLDTTKEAMAQVVEKLKDSHTRLGKAQFELKQTQQALLTSQNSETALKTEINKHLEQDKLSRQTIGDLSTQLEEAKLRATTAEHVAEDALDLTEATQQENKALKQSLSDTEKQVKQAQNQLDLHKKSLEEQKQFTVHIKKQHEQQLAEISRENSGLRNQLFDHKQETKKLVQTIQGVVPPSRPTHTSLHAAVGSLVISHSSLSKALTQERTRNNEVQHELHTTQLSLEQKSRELDKEREQLLNTQKQVTTLGQQLDQQKLEHGETLKKLEDASHKLEVSKKTETELQKQNQSLQTQLTTATTQKDQEAAALREQLNSALKEIETLKTKNQTLTQDLSKEKENSQANLETIKQLEEQIRLSSIESLKTQKLLTQLKTELQDSKKQISLLTKRNNDQDHTLQQSEEELRKSSTELSEAKAKVSSLQAEIEKLTQQLQAKESVDRTNAQLMEQLTRSETTRNSLLEEFTVLQATHKDVVSQRASIVAELAGLKELQHTTQEENSRLKKQELELQQQLSDNSRLSEEGKQQLQTRINELQDNLKTTEQANVHFQSQIRELNETLNSKETALTEKQQQVNQLQSSLDKISGDAATTQEKLNNELKILRQSEQTAREETGKVNTARSEQERVLAETRKQLSEQSDLAKNLSEQLLTAQKQQAELNAQMLNQKQAYDQETKALKATASQKQKEFASLSAEQQALKKAKQALVEQNTKLSTAIGKLKTVNAGQSEQITTLNTMMEKALKGLEKSEEKVKTLETVVSKAQAIEQQNHQLRTQWLTLRKDLSETISQITSESDAKPETPNSLPPEQLELDDQSLRNAIDELKSKWKALILSNEKLTASNSQIRDKLSEAKEELSKQTKQVGYLSIQLGESEKHKLDAEQAHKDSQKQLSDEISKSRALTEQLGESDELKSSVEQSLQRSMKKVKELEKKLTREKVRTDSWEQDCRKSWKELEAAEKKLAILAKQKALPSPPETSKPDSSDSAAKADLHKEITRLNKELTELKDLYQQDVMVTEEEVDQLSKDKLDHGTQIARRNEALRMLVEILATSQQNITELQELLRKAEPAGKYDAIADMVSSLGLNSPTIPHELGPILSRFSEWKIVPKAANQQLAAEYAAGLIHNILPTDESKQLEETIRLTPQSSQEYDSGFSSNTSDDEDVTEGIGAGQTRITKPLSPSKLRKISQEKGSPSRIKAQTPPTPILDHPLRVN